MHLLSKFGGSSLNVWWIMAWTSSGLTDTGKSTHTHTETDAGNDITQMIKGSYEPILLPLCNYQIPCMWCPSVFPSINGSCQFVGNLQFYPIYDLVGFQVSDMKLWVMQSRRPLRVMETWYSYYILSHPRGINDQRILFNIIYTNFTSCQ